MKKILLAILLIIFSLVSKAVSKPNFIIIYLDDMGFPMWDCIKMRN